MTKTVTLRSGDMIWRYEVRSWRKKRPHVSSGWRIHCCVEVTELSTNKQHNLVMLEGVNFFKDMQALYLVIASVIPESSYQVSSNRMYAHVPEGQPHGHPMCQTPSWHVGEKLELCVPSVWVLVLEFFHELNRIVVSYNLLFMRAKILRQDMQEEYWDLWNST